MKTISWKFGFWHNSDEKAYKNGFTIKMVHNKTGDGFRRNTQNTDSNKQMRLSDDGFGLSTADNLEEPFYTGFYRYFVKKSDFQEIVITVSTVLKPDF